MKNLNKILSLCLGFMLLNQQSIAQNNQTLLSEYWSGPGGQIEAPILSTLTTKTDDMHNVYVAGATLNASTNKLDMMVQKFSRSGDLLWQTTFGGALNEDDMAADLFIDDNYNVYVTGAVAETAQNFYDLAVIKLNNNGVVQWEYYYDYGGSPLPYDAGTAITGDNDGHIYVTGSSAGNNTNSDYVIIKLTTANANEVWIRRYDYAQFDDIPAKIELYSNNTRVVVSGGSQIDDSPVTWEIAMVVMDSSNQVFEDYRTGQSITSGISEVYDMTVDANDNIYIVGTKKDATSDYDIIVYKLDDELNLIWEETYDGYGEDDRGKGIKVDNQGNVYVAGYVTTLNEGKNYSLLKYDSNGNLDWSREYNGMASQDDEAVQLVITDNNKVFVTGSATHGNNTNFVTLGYDENGTIFNEISFDGSAGLNDFPTNMGIDLEGNIIVVGQTQTGGSNYENVTVKYTVHEKPLDFSNEVNNPHELIIRFDTSAIIYSAIDRKEFYAGMLQDFVKEEVLDTLFHKTGFSWRRLDTYKIFRGMTTADTVSETRLGELHRIDDFWATLSVFLPEEEDEQEVIDSLETLYPIVHYSELNGILKRANIPNDILLSLDEQAGLLPTFFYPDAHINMEDAWSIEVGHNRTKVGVYDDPIYWAHEDFGDGTYNGSKINGGWDYINNVSISAISNSVNSHGTSVAGIIGALRNNSLGVAGIAGGDVDSLNNFGCQLYSFGILDGDSTSLVSTAAAAIVEGASEMVSGYGYGLHIQNHSYAGDEPHETLRSAVQTAWRNHSIFVAARGNDGNADLKYPACFKDEMVLNTGASGFDGEYKNVNNGDATFGPQNAWESSYGGDIDFIAPGCTELVTAPYNPNSPYWFPNTSFLSGEYHTFTGTSAAAPHVAGLAALMHSKHHTDNGAPNNLTTEDVEKILEKTATDVSGGLLNYPVGYDMFNGWGLINAGKALEQVNYPEYYVQHSSNVPPFIIEDLDLNIIVANPTDGIAAGSYTADKFTMEFTYIDVLPSNLEIIDWWQDKARTFEGVSHVNPITGDRWMDVNPNVTIGGNTATIEVSTVVWFIKNSTIQVVNKWIPSYGPTQVKYAYSLHVHDKTLETSKANITKQVTIYPNPTAEDLTLSIELDNSTELDMEIYTIDGKLVAKPKIGKKNAGKHEFVINTSHLDGGVYVVRLFDGKEIIIKKFVKQ